MAVSVYTPPRTLRQFMLDDARRRFVIGPLGSGKTTAMIYESLRRAAEQAPGPDGVRRTRAAVIRNTLKQLMSTVLPDIQSVLGPIARFHVTTSCIRIRIGDVQSDWYLMPLETAQDTRRLLSMQLTWAWMAEFREIPYELVPAISGRVGRYPSMKHGGVKPSWYGVFGESNPFNLDSSWNEHLVEDLPTGWAFFHQPGGRSPRAENVANLPDGYYEDLIQGADEGWVKVHVDALIGESLEGKGVWRSSFDRGFHVAKGPLDPIPSAPLIFSFDFGRTPACLVAQVDPRGRIVVLHEITSEDTGLETFVSARLVPWLNMNRLAGYRRIVVGDPSGAYKAQDSESSCFAVLKAAGFRVSAADTNEIWPRIGAVEKRLQMRAGILISPECRVLVRAMAGAYKFRRKKTGEYEDIPEKLHPVSDVADALQYLCLLVDGRGYSRAAQMQQIKPRPAPPAGAWT